MSDMFRHKCTYFLQGAQNASFKTNCQWLPAVIYKVVQSAVAALLMSILYKRYILYFIDVHLVLCNYLLQWTDCIDLINTQNGQL